MPLLGNISVFGIYSHFRALRTSVDVLKSFGFCKEDIAVLLPEHAIANALSIENQPKPMAQTGNLVQPRIEPLIGGTVGWLTCVEAAKPGLVASVLTDIGVPNANAQGYGTFLRMGELFLRVRSLVPPAAERAEVLLRRTGAHHIARALHIALPVPLIHLAADVRTNDVTSVPV